MIGTIITLAIILCGLALLPAFMASQKGRSFLVWWIYGVLLFPVALVHALLLGVSFASGTKSCGFCRMKVSVTATHCPRCGHEFIDV
jgi:hypothetical protein